MTRLTLSFAALLASTSTVLADPGAHHYSFVESLTHALTEPDHLAMLAVATAAAVFLVRRYKAQ